MVIILSNTYDFSTNDVIYWLNSKGTSYTRINPIDTLHINFKNEFTKNSTNSYLLLKNGLKINNSMISSFWYRRGYFIDNSFIRSKAETNIEIEKEKFLVSEKKSLIEYFNSQIIESKKLGSYDKYEVNKLKTLELAVKHKIQIPHTLITSQKQDLISFYNKLNGNLIMKPILDGIHRQVGDDFYNMYTSRIDEELINQLPNTFYETKFQEELDKKVELRIFFIKEKFYPMAIFSQKDKQTQVDFRVYNNLNPNRKTPFKLPKLIENKLNSLMKEIGLNTGSIDMVYTRQKEFVFLEVNPVGQFKMTSTPCNYYLEREIAKTLTKINE